MMKRIALVGLLITCCLLGKAQATQFYKGPWKNLLAEAKRSHKPFFVDFYAVWCGPCKLMVKNTFNNAEVSQYVNGHYLAYSLDAEQGEGVSLAENYKIEGYPTVMVFSPEGAVLGKLVGYQDAPTFLQALQRLESKMGTQGLQGDLPNAKEMHHATQGERASLGALFSPAPK